MSWRKRAFFVLITWGLLLLFAEASLQLFYRASVGMWLWEWWAIPIFETDALRVYRLKENLDFTHKTREFTARYFTNPLGMRTDEKRQTPEIPKPPGVFRLLALGPSFTFGWGVNYEDSYMYKIAQGLRVPGRRVELLNLGTPSQPQSYQLRWLKQAGYRFEPDLVVLTVYGDIPGIDSDDTLPDNGVCVRDGHLFPARTMTWSMWVRRFRRYSAVLFYGWHIWQAVLPSKDAPAGDGRELYRKVDPSSDGLESRTLKEYQDYVRFVHQVLTNKPPVIFLHVPTAYIVRPADLSRVAHHGTKVDPLAERQKTALLAGALRSQGLNIIETTSVLVEQDRNTRMYNLYDVHFTRTGNEVVARHALPLIQETVDHARPGAH